MKINCPAKLILLSFLMVSSKLFAQVTTVDSLKQFYIVDTIVIENPKLLYVNEKVKSIDKFTTIVLSQSELEKAKINKVAKAEQILLSNECYILKDYNDLISILQQSNIDISAKSRGIDISKDSCYSSSKNTVCCNLTGLKTNRFIIAAERVSHYNYYRVIEHKRLNLDMKFVLIAFPFE